MTMAVLGAALTFLRNAGAETYKEAWFYAAAQFDVTRDWTGAIGGAARYNDALDGLSDRFVELQVGRKLSGDWTVTPSFRVNHAQTSAGLARREIQPGLALQWRGNFANWGVRTRGRLEYRDFDTLTSDGWRFRFRIRLEPPMSEGSRWQPYLSNETFHDRGEGFIDENRVFAGTNFGFDQTWSGDVFVGWRHRVNAVVLANSVIAGVGLRARF